VFELGLGLIQITIDAQNYIYSLRALKPTIGRLFRMKKKTSGFGLIMSCILMGFSSAGMAVAGMSVNDEKQDLDAAADRIELDPLVIVANKSPRPLSEVAAQVTVINNDDIREGMAEDLDGMLKYEPGLDMETAGTRFGASSINIRGIGGNRVAIEIDGIPVRDQFAIGSYSNGGRALVEPDRIKRVEVLHGPASVMYGSNAIGGVVAISTWDPADLLSATDNSAWLGLRAGYQGVNDSWVGSGVAAWGEGAHGLLAAATYRDGHELDNQAPAEIPDDPQEWDSRDFMFRYTYDTNGGNQLRLSAQSTERDVKTEINSLLGYGRRFRNTTELLGDDHDESRRLSLDYLFSAGGWEQGTLRVFDVNHDTDQLTLEERAKGANPVDISRRFLYGQDISGVKLNLFREVIWGSSLHRIGTGAEWMRTDITEMRDGLQTSRIDGSTTNVILGEEMPVRDFPISRTDEYGIFLQDEISLADGRWELSPALRWDRYELDPKPDQVWLEDNPDTPVVAVSEDQITPRIGILFHPGDLWTFYGQYSQGFRAPPFEDANIGFDIPLFGFRAIPNPDLKSETSEGIELGMRRITRSSSMSLTLFDTDYDDFIESRVLIGIDPATGDLIFQSRNIDKARIYGADIRYDQDLSAWHPSMQGWMLNLAAYWAEGDNRQTDQPLNSIAPPQAVLGLSWVSMDGAWDFSANGTLTAAKKDSDIDQTDGERFATPSWETVDFTAGWRPSGRLELRAGIFNLGDKTYWRWLDVANMEADDPMIALLSRPGRSYSVTARFTF
jgi:hemoglobin/transferrin/lactoferrin receptor protein